MLEGLAKFVFSDKSLPLISASFDFSLWKCQPPGYAHMASRLGIQKSVCVCLLASIHSGGSFVPQCESFISLAIAVDSDTGFLSQHISHEKSPGFYDLAMLEG